MTASSRSAPQPSHLLPSAPAVEVIQLMLARRSTARLAELIGLDRRTVQRLASRPLIRRDAADRLAVALGRHPSEIWVEWFDLTDE